MDSLFFHPKVVHLPIALAVLMPLIAGGILLAWHRKWLPSRSWIIPTLLQAVLVVSGIVALKTGESEEERVEEVVAESAIEAHEEAAELFVWGGGAVLVLMVGATALAGRKEGKLLASAAVAGTLVVLILGYRTGQEGGELVYEHGAASAYTGSSVADQGLLRESDHEDD